MLSAGGPNEAGARAKARAGHIHLLITDVVMPEINGRDLLERLRAAKPGLKCLFMSGCTDDVITRRGMLEEGTPFIQKPFSTKARGRQDPRGHGRLRDDE